MNDKGAWTERRDELLARVVRRGRARKVRRWSLGAAGVALVAAVVAFGVVTADSGPQRSLRVQNPDGPPTTTRLVETRPAGVLLVGDSVMLGARSALELGLPGARVETAADWRFRDAVPILEAVRSAGSLPRTVVVHLGTNGAFEEEQFAQVMETVGAGSSVYFVTLAEPRTWEDAVNSALYSEAPRFANAHVLDWHGYSEGKPWFAADRFHLAGEGPTQYAQFIRNGIEPEPTTYADPFHGATVPATGFYVTSDPKSGKSFETTTSFAVRIVDETSGVELGELPRASIDSSVTNVARKRLVVTDDGIRLEAIPLSRVTGVPDGCTQTETNTTLAVALCGPSGGQDQLLGDRVLVNRGTGWQELIAKPPGAGGGHWNWASPSPDGQWVLADWSGECEVPTSLFVRVADRAVHAVTGEPDIGGPNSGDLGWTRSSDALAVFGDDNPGCGTAASVPRGVYEVSPTTGARRLVLPLAPDEGVTRWTEVDDRRTSREAPGSPVSVDLDGDGRLDTLSVHPR
jgi:hypothetical protein